MWHWSRGGRQGPPAISFFGKEIFWQKSPFRDWFQEQQAQNLLHCVTWPLQSLSHKTITHLQTILPKQHILPNHFKTICVHQAWGLAPWPSAKAVYPFPKWTKQTPPTFTLTAKKGTNQWYQISLPEEIFQVRNRIFCQMFHI